MDIAIPLALVAFPDELSCMVSTNPFMDLFENILGFLFVYTLQVRHGKTSFVQCVI